MDDKDLNREFYEKLAKYTIEYEEKRKRLVLADLDRRSKEIQSEKPTCIDNEQIYRLIRNICPDYKVPKEFFFMFETTKEELK
jgi:hypothetical protein